MQTRRTRQAPKLTEPQETKPQQKAALDNPWYQLARLHGDPADADDERAAKNRETWNRWMAPRLPEELKAALRMKGWSDQELTPFSEDKRQSIAARVGLSLEADRIDFANTRFEADFFAKGFVFLNVDFSGATFSRETIFESATFSGSANFSRATFGDDALFSGATFSRVASFDRATFSGGADFGRATFSDGAYFDRATFSNYAIFTNAEMKGVTAFDNAIFDSPPECSNATLHERTTWHDVRWPSTPSDVIRARAFLGAYACLKREMDRLKKHGDELDFFARELQCQRVELGFWKGLPIAIYGFLSGYGRSYGRPLVLIAAVLLVGAFLSAFHLVGFWAPMPGRAFGLSFANTFSVLGIRKDFIDPETIKVFPEWLTVVATVQSILGIVLLFLFGLSIRNRFRIK